MSEIDYQFVRSPNVSSRRDTQVDCVVLHHTGSMSLSKTVRLFQGQESGISAHFVIPRNVEEGVIQMVNSDDKAWHAGRAQLWRKGDVNLYSVGVQLVGTKESGYTEWQYVACASVCADLMNRYPKILMNRVVGHDAVGERENGPGPLWNWTLFFDLLVRKLYELKMPE